MFVNCLVKQFAMCVAVVAILLLNIMDVFSVRGGALLDRLRNYYWLHANTDGVVLCVWDRVYDRLLTHVCDALRCEDEVWVVVFLPSRTVE